MNNNIQREFFFPQMECTVDIRKTSVHEVKSSFVVIVVIHLFQVCGVIILSEKPIKFTFHLLEISNWYQVPVTDVQSPDRPVESIVQFPLAKILCSTVHNVFVNVVCHR